MNILTVIFGQTLGTLSPSPNSLQQDRDVTCVAMTSSYPGLLHLTLLGFLLVVIPSSPRPPRRGTCPACHDGAAFLGKLTKENLRARLKRAMCGRSLRYAARDRPPSTSLLIHNGVRGRGGAVAVRVRMYVCGGTARRPYLLDLYVRGPRPATVDMLWSSFLLWVSCQTPIHLPKVPQLFQDD